MSLAPPATLTKTLNLTRFVYVYIVFFERKWPLQMDIRTDPFMLHTQIMLHPHMSQHLLQSQFGMSCFLRIPDLLSGIFRVYVRYFCDKTTSSRIHTPHPLGLAMAAEDAPPGRRDAGLGANRKRMGHPAGWAEIPRPTRPRHVSFVSCIWNTSGTSKYKTKHDRPLSRLVAPPKLHPQNRKL